MWATDLKTFTWPQPNNYHATSHIYPYSFVPLKNKANLFKGSFYHQEHLVTSICDLIAPDKGS